ncbi:MAG TPA: NAD(P)H-dependent glycerol-3-phosphate dehydrogenase [Kiloniellales bacterium]|nr:NAD(P)H-dependent glycerol-3-phosphate dehydrogenase [Kiloniellales bacterium]
MERFGIIGAGAWGSALAVALRAAGRGVVLLARDAALAEAIGRDHENAIYLPGVALDPDIEATPDPASLKDCDALLLAVPAQPLRETCTRLLPSFPADAPVIVCAKGIERGSGRLMTEVLAEVLPDRAAPVLSGPTFAAEVARGLPTAVTLACADPALGAALVESLGSRAFRPYLSADPVGAQIGGAVKNVIAIACGIVEGRGMGDNARAAIITRGLAEISRLGRALGARPETLMGLSGLGDLVLTCTSTLSRNYTLGLALGEGRALDEVLAERRTVAEGIYTAGAVTARAAEAEIEMPIAEAIRAILDEGADIERVIERLLARPFKTESH